MRKNRILVTGAAAAAALALAGCGGGGGDEGGGDASSLSILDYYDNEPDSTLVQEALDACAETVGVTIEPPTTWDELKESAAALTEGDQYGVAFSAIADYEGAWQFLPFMWTNGGEETDLDSPENAEALQLWVDLIEGGSASAGTVNWSQGDVKDQFVAGKAAMMVNGPWQIPAMADTDFEWDSVLLPVNEEGTDPVAPLGGELWTVPETGKPDVQAKAAEFVECMSSEEISLSIAESRYLVPTRTDLIDGYVSEEPEMAAFGEQIKTARARTAELGEEWPEAATVIYNAVQLAVTGEASADEAFAKAAQG